MSKTKEDLFQILDAKMFGVDETPPHNHEHMYYYQNVYIRGIISENFVYIKLCNDNENFTEYDRKFKLNLYKLIDGVKDTKFNEESFEDSPAYKIHGSSVKILTLNRRIIAIGHINGKFWIPTSNFLSEIEDINEFKKSILKEELESAFVERENFMEKINKTSSYINDLVRSYCELSGNNELADLLSRALY